MAADAVDLDIRDTGTGTGVPHLDGQGIAGMRERAAIYGGQVTAGPDPAGGWRVRARLNLGAAA